MKWLAVCDECGFRRWNDELRRKWNGLMVCRDTCWEARNAQESVRGKADRQAPPWVRPEPADTFDFTYLLREDGQPFLRERGFGLKRES